MDKITVVILALILLIVFSFICYRSNKKYPPLIKKGDNKDKDDFYIVKTFTVARFGGYIEHTIVKKKNGKYRLKYSILYILFIIFTVGILVGPVIWLFINYLINHVEPIDIKNILLFLFAFVFTVALSAILHISVIVAWIYFNKYIKRQKSKKRKR